MGLTVLAAAASALLASAARAEALRVVVTIKPVHGLVSLVMAGIDTPTLLVDGQASPHSFSLKPSDARALQGADVVVRVSAAVEPFTVRITQSLPASAVMVTLAKAPGVKLLEMRRGTAFEEHDHGGSEGKDHAHDHDHDVGGPDGHIWLDPDNAKVIIKHVADVLAKKRPDLKDRLDANATAAIAEIDRMDAELKGKLAPLSAKPFIVFHDAYQYFERHYGLHAAGAITLNPEVKPSARRLAEIRSTLTKNGAKCVFAEPQFSPKVISAVIEDTAAKAGTLDPLGSTLPAGPAHYAAMMRALSDALAGCLGG
ncbi:MAG: zinc ABC transporter substrate-binding protein [Hyphomicrobiaceae bacterium]|nr:zinc ABC transporter substrate-binding protein [Hyphomicrobiaceae bacterium]MCC0008718.1 zinc ABC transporter substrate-binding protein [Hyphomicrobiaceae bacterium]